MIVAQLVERDGQLLFDGKPLRDGDWLEVLVWDGLTNKMTWIETQIFKTNFGCGTWEMADCRSYQLNGLFARL